MLVVEERDVFFEDGGVIKIIRGGGEVGVDEGQQLKVEFLALFDYFDQRIHCVHL